MNPVGVDVKARRHGAVFQYLIHDRRLVLCRARVRTCVRVRRCVRICACARACACACASASVTPARARTHARTHARNAVGSASDVRPKRSDCLLIITLMGTGHYHTARGRRSHGGECSQTQVIEYLEKIALDNSVRALPWLPRLPIALDHAPASLRRRLA